MLKNCGGGPRPIRLCVEKTYNFDEIQQRRTCRPKQKCSKILIGPYSPNLKPFEYWTCPTCLKIAREALGLLGCVFKRLKILMKFNSDGPVSKNGPKF